MNPHRRFRQVEHPRDLLGGELLPTLEEHGRPLLRGELLDRLPDLAHVSLRPHGLGGIHERRRVPLDGIAALALLARASPAHEPTPSPAPALMVKAAVDEDPVEPGGELRLPREGPRRLVQTNEGFLGAILGVFSIAHDGPGDAIRPLLVALHEVVEGSPVPFRDSLAERFIGRRESLHWRRSSHMVVGEPKPWPGLASASLARPPSVRLPGVRRHRLAVRLQGGYWANLLRQINSALASRQGRSARKATFSVASNAQRTPTYASRCRLPRAWWFELRGGAPRRGLSRSGSQLDPIPNRGFGLTVESCRC